MEINILQIEELMITERNLTVVNATGHGKLLSGTDKRTWRCESRSSSRHDTK
jgi:hypothetical protein